MKKYLLLGLAFLGMSYAQEPINIEGFDVPESIVHYEGLDLYLVSNISGDPFAEDDNGFISQVSPEGMIIDLKWIDGAEEGITLNAPKGLTLVGDQLYVADLDTVRIFDAESGTSLNNILIPGTTFLNDITAGPDGNVYVTDSGFAPGFEGTGTDAIYAIDATGEVTALASSTELNNPNGIVVLEDGSLFIAPLGTNATYVLGNDGELVSNIFPASSLDGVVLLKDGEVIVSSWETSSIYQGSGEDFTTIIEDIPSPADIGYDVERNRILIPVFSEDRIILQDLNDFE